MVLSFFLVGNTADPRQEVDLGEPIGLASAHDGKKSSCRFSAV
jgi:hypothetical protein